MDAGGLSFRNAFSVIVVVQICNSIILGFTNNVGTDMWISLLVTMILSAPLMLLYARLVRLMPGNNIFQMAEGLLGRPFAIAVAVFYAYYFIILASITRGYYAQFVHVTSLKQTPFIVILFAFFIICSYVAKSGITTLGRWSGLILVFSCGITIIMTLLSIPVMNVANLLPLYSGGARSIWASGLHGVALPMGEIIMVFGFVGNLDKKINPYKLFLSSMLFTIAFLMLVYFQNTTVLGAHVADAVFYPFYTAATLISLNGDIRIESLIMLAFLLAGITKVSVGIKAGTNAVSHIFKIKDDGRLVLPIAFFTVALSPILFYSNMDMFDFIEIYPIFAFPFQVIVPVVLWVAAELRRRKEKRMGNIEEGFAAGP